MNIKNLNLGDKVNFEVNEKTIQTKYSGKFDFLHCFDTSEKLLPFTTTLDKASIVIANFNLLKQYNLSNDEIKSILYHEEGHLLSTNQKNKSGLDLEIDADDYATTFVDINTIISALEKTKDIIVNESENKDMIESKIDKIDKRIEHLKLKKKDDITR